MSDLKVFLCLIRLEGLFRPFFKSMHALALEILGVN